MNTKLLGALILIMTKSTYAAFSHCERVIPPSPHFAFARAILKSKQTISAKSKALTNACSELDTKTVRGQFSQRAHKDFSIAKKLLLSSKVSLSLGSSAFTHLKKSDVEKKFKSELEKIKEIKNPIQRIQAAYDMTIRYQGKYRNDKNGKAKGGGIFTSPRDIIIQADKEGAAGVCRDFAKLLYWTLMQVQRPKGEKSNFSQLGKNSFSVDFIVGFGKVNANKYGHAWLRVNLPHKRNGFLEFERFDIDTTWYTKRFTPVMPRHQGWSNKNLKKLHNQCKKIKECLDSPSHKKRSDDSSNLRSHSNF